MTACSCLIPFHNERRRILDVLRAVTQVPSLNQIVCVDDGSDEDATPHIHFSRVQVHRLPQNLGKAGAVRAGLSVVEGDYVLLLDADLRCLEPREIHLAVRTILSNDNIDMIILRRIHAALHSKILRGNTLFVGERILRTEDLARVLDSEPEGYQLEIAINQYMMDRGKRVHWMPSSARNTLKMEKVGALTGFARDLIMAKNILGYSGLGGYVRQFLDFGRERAPNGRPPGIF